MPINYDVARELLGAHFSTVEKDVLTGEPPYPIPEHVDAACRRLFQSNTQAYRETLLGCAVARVLDNSVNIRRIYVNQGEGAYNGRSLDEKAVNPFLQGNRIPSSKGPYLSCFRRSVSLNEATRDGLRDKAGYDALLTCAEHLEGTDDSDEQHGFLRHLLYRFAELREQSNVPLNRVNRFSLQQYGSLMERLLSTPSGGRFPLFVIVAAFKAVKERFGAMWEVQWQGINVADSQTGAGGDVNLVEGEAVVLSAEITERVVGRERIVSTFNTKIGPAGIRDYLFFVLEPPDTDAATQSYQYFAQGHDVNFAVIRDWIVMTLATIGAEGRAVFNRELLELLGGHDVPQALKVAWNNHVNHVTSNPV